MRIFVHSELVVARAAIAAARALYHGPCGHAALQGVGFAHRWFALEATSTTTTKGNGSGAPRRAQKSFRFLPCGARRDRGRATKGDGIVHVAVPGQQRRERERERASTERARVSRIVEGARAIHLAHFALQARYGAAGGTYGARCELIVLAPAACRAFFFAKRLCRSHSREADVVHASRRRIRTCALQTGWRASSRRR